MALVLRKLVYIIIISLILCIEMNCFLGCAKEYSYEGDPSRDTIPIGDTAATIPVSLPFCAGCSGMDDFIFLKWSCKYDTSLLCGNITDAVITPDRNAFTFFGPSACSLDTGLVMTVYLDSDSLNRDKNGLTINHTIFEYYDNTTNIDIFNSGKLGFSLTIDTYEHSTGIAKGRFSGNVYTKDSTLVTIADGKFYIKFK